MHRQHLCANLFPSTRRWSSTFATNGAIQDGNIGNIIGGHSAPLSLRNGTMPGRHYSAMGSTFEPTWADLPTRHGNEIDRVIDDRIYRSPMFEAAGNKG